MQGKKFRQRRKVWYRGLKKTLVIRYKKPRFKYLGDKPNENSIVLSNHVGTDAPMSLELHADFPLRMWGTSEMNSGLIKLYKYQSRVYYHEKKGWNLHSSRFFCLLASPLTNLFYKGLRLVSTYKDSRFKKTINDSYKIIKEEKENIVIFPEKSDDGYLDQLTGFHPGFILLAETCLKRGIDISIYVSYFNKKEMTYTFSKPMKYKELKDKFTKRSELIDYLVNECNSLNNA